ncbi:MAG: ABC transporter permease [Rhodobacteraceae bacterium]|nr:ABC transporter permease [Paracoccaceae bacterium]
MTDALAAPLPPRPRRLRVLAALCLRETAARFGAARGGILWAFAEPAGGIAALSLAFGLIVRAPPAGDSFAFFYATGLLPFLMVTTLAGAGMAAMQQNAGLSVFPVVRPLDAVLARLVLDALVLAGVAAGVFAGLLALVGPQGPVDPGLFLASLGLAAALGAGLGLANAAIADAAPVWRHVWSVVTRPLFLVSGILFSIDSMPQDLRLAFWLNPLTHPVGLMRAAFYGVDEAGAVSLTYAGGIALALCTLGAAAVRRRGGRR